MVLNPEGLRIGSIGEDFAFESMPGDIFQLGNTSYKVQKVEVNKVFVEDARGQAPTIPFWFGEAPARSDELSAAVSRLRETALERLDGEPESLERWLGEDIGLDPAAARQLADYFATARLALGTLPTLDTVVFERFFDDVGDTHLVIHSTYGSRVNRAWGLALRKRFCRQFNFELQAAALEDSIVLSLGPTHSFPLEDVEGLPQVRDRAGCAGAGTARRTDVRHALALGRGHLARSPSDAERQGAACPVPARDSEDLLAVVFPDQLACAENLIGKREVPDHPLVKQTMRRLPARDHGRRRLPRLLGKIEDGRSRWRCRDLTSPSPLSHAVLGARPYAFLDDGDAEGRRTRSITMDRHLEAYETATDLGRLDPEAIDRAKGRPGRRSVRTTSCTMRWSCMAS